MSRAAFPSRKAPLKFQSFPALSALVAEVAQQTGETVRYLEAQDLNRKLAAALRWRRQIHTDGGGARTELWHAPDGTVHAQYPDWAGDWNACAALMVAHECYPQVIEIGGNDEIGAEESAVRAISLWSYSVVVPVPDFPNEEAAVRYAILKAVLYKLTGELI